MTAQEVARACRKLGLRVRVGQRVKKCCLGKQDTSGSPTSRPTTSSGWRGRDEMAGALSDEFEILKIVTARLDAAGIGYMVTGSMALNYYAVPRMTRDIDVVAELAAADADRMADLFRDDFYVELETVRESIERRRTFNLIHHRLVVKVDVVVRKDSDYRRTEFARRRRVTLEGHPFFIVAPEDLLISKLDWARDTRSDVQLTDARNLLRSASDLDRSYLEHWISRLELDALYREVSA